MRPSPDAVLPRPWLLGLLLVSACSPSATENGASEPTPGFGEPRDYAGGQSGDEGTQLASPCIPSDRTAFLGELEKIDGGIASVLLTEPLTQAAANADPLAERLEGCVSGYFTTVLPSPGEDVLVVLIAPGENKTPPALAIVGMQGDQAMFAGEDSLTPQSLDELLAPNCFVNWQNETSASSEGEGAATSGAAIGSCDAVD